MTTETISMEKFCKDNLLKIISIKVFKNPHMEDNDIWKATHWQSKLYFASGKNWPREMVTHYSMGIGHKGKPPKVEEVLNCLASDSSGVENARNYEDFAMEFGYDLDSRKGEETYKICVKQAEQLKEFLGNELYEALLWNTERL